MNNTEFGNISFDLPKNQSHVIKVIGVGGGGSNAINFMYKQGIKGVDFIICNTDAQALENSPVPNKIQLGVSLTEGMGAGANPEIGERAALESVEDIKKLLMHQTKMLFITAGMGGGTGTGAAPIIAKMAKDMNILTVGIVTMPFSFEGKLRNEQAQKGLENLRRNVDSIVIINNNKLREVYGNLGFKAGFSKADEVLSTASRGIAEVITHHYTQNIDLHDAKTVLSNSGTAIMGSAKAKGENRAQEAIIKALDSPLLNDNKITGAKNVLLLIVFGSDEITLDEIGEINDHIQSEAGNGANIIMGVGEDETLEDAISVTVIATGFHPEQQNEIVHTESKKIIHTLEEEQKAEQDLTPKASFSTLEHNFEKKVPKENIQSNNLENNIEENVLIKTDDSIRNTIVVDYEEIKSLETDTFVIHEMEDTPNEEFDTTTKATQDDLSHNIYDEKQVTLTFDLPKERRTEKEQTEHLSINKDDDKVRHDIHEIEVNEAKEFIPFEASDETGMKKYSLEDYMDFENALVNSKAPQEKKAEVADPETDFKKTVMEKETSTDSKPADEHADPFDGPISHVLKARADERRRKMKEFNYKFNHSSARIEEYEKEPAYKRMGVELEQRISSQHNLSRTSLSVDENKEINLKTNNSFLHDNVD
ncbi:MAG: cell division protein FtsZ [Bacteroidetes bacterium]|nr:cell division protein FtsZ [Bacteroidota bacterium]